MTIREGVPYRLGKRQRELPDIIDSPGSPSGSQGYKEINKRRRRAKIGLSQTAWGTGPGSYANAIVRRKTYF